MATARIGISGWRYAPWRGVFYPPKLPQREELAFASRQLSSIELNGTFYSLQKPEYFRTWAQQAPEDFVFAAKGPRFITHMKKLAGVEVPLANFFASGLLALGPKLGPILWQLPPTLGFDPKRIAEFAALLPRTTAAAAELAQQHDERLKDRALILTDADRPLRHAFEVRHASFDTPAFTDLLRELDIAVVVADTAGKWPQLLETTSDMVYVRLHGADELYVSGYTDDALDLWAGRVRHWLDGGRDVFVYFDNDVKVRAPFDAQALARRLGVGP